MWNSQPQDVVRDVGSNSLESGEGFAEPKASSPCGGGADTETQRVRSAYDCGLLIRFHFFSVRKVCAFD